ncbi:fasciclin domain-containing protein [Paracoccus binzhouensis]|nr:fasciclin domain-containing protein [Paracoccus binzhouensis]
MNPMVGGAKMYESKPIAANASAAPNLTTLVAAVKAAGLVETLSGPGPFTVFAPTNDAFDKLPAGTVETLVKPENKETLTKILTCHVASGVITAENIVATIEKGKGMAKIETLGGCELTATMKDGMVMLTDPKGDVATVETADVRQSNGMVHVISTVMLPKM